jgi:hypothetical protein
MSVCRYIRDEVKAKKALQAGLQGVVVFKVKQCNQD